MAREQESETTEEKSEQEITVEKAAEAKAVVQKAPWPLITIGIFATIIIIAFITICAVTLLHNRQTTSRNSFGADHMGMNNSDFGSQRGSINRPGGMSGGRGSFMTPAASGVITAINGDTITVAGGGKQVTVKKTTSTVISGSKSDIAVNDTVVVTGTTSDDGSVTATRIMIRNNQNFERPTADDTSAAPGA